MARVSVKYKQDLAKTLNESAPVGVRYTWHPGAIKQIKRQGGFILGQQYDPASGALIRQWNVREPQTIENQLRGRFPRSFTRRRM